jgi:hypothetical protein
MTEGEKSGSHPTSLAKLFCCLILLLAAPAILRAAPARAEVEARARELIRQADVTYTTTFTWPCSASTWECILDHPLLMGALWEAYGYAPAYKTSARGDTLHLADPTGLIGDALRFHREPGGASYLVDGKLDHWAVPFFNEASAVFILTSRSAQNQIVADLKVYVRAGSAVGSLVLQATKPLLAEHVDNRVTLNLQDARKIVEAINTSPAQVASHLSGLPLEQFEITFPK